MLGVCRAGRTHLTGEPLPQPQRQGKLWEAFLVETQPPNRSFRADYGFAQSRFNAAATPTEAASDFVTYCRPQESQLEPQLSRGW